MAPLRFVLLSNILVLPITTIAQDHNSSGDWLDNPAAILMTTEEREVRKTSSTDVDTTKFIDVFWARRDPTPDTQENEFADLPRLPPPRQLLLQHLFPVQHDIQALVGR